MNFRSIRYLALSGLLALASVCALGLSSVQAQHRGGGGHFAAPRMAPRMSVQRAPSFHGGHSSSGFHGGHAFNGFRGGHTDFGFRGRGFRGGHSRIFIGSPFLGWGYPYYWDSYPYWNAYGYGYYPYDAPAYRSEQGFYDGFKDGRSDARKGKPDDPNSHGRYRDSDSNAYRNAFVRAYAQGYSDYARR